VALPPINMLSLCAGYGGLDLGVELVLGRAARVVCYVEREAAAAAILAGRMEQAALAPAPVWGDLRTFDGRRWRGVVDLLSAGYPCQPFSHAGRRGGHDDPRHLWPQVARIVQEVEPGIVWLENVPGHLSLGAETVLLHLRLLGYRATAGLFSAEEAGAPHRRVRMFILGVADSEGLALGVHAGQRGPGAGAPGAHEAGGAVVNAERAGPRQGVAGEQGAAGKRRRRSPDAGGSLADAPRDGRGGRGIVGGSSLAGRDGHADRGNELPLWPPGPSERERWADIVRAFPDLAPAVEPRVRGVAHGHPSRLDRLRALGNGVVPLVAAHAFVSLWACLEAVAPKEG